MVEMPVMLPLVRLLKEASNVAKEEALGWNLYFKAFLGLLIMASI